VGKLSNGGTVGVAGFLLLLESGMAWAGSYNPTTSDGSLNTAGGEGANPMNMGAEDTAFGYYALGANIGAENTAFGYYALYNNTDGWLNTASGYYALGANTTGNYNTAAGSLALHVNTEDNYNTASGYGALNYNQTYSNTASGAYALYNNSQGNSNTAIGISAGQSNTTGSDNTFIGGAADANAGIYTNGTALGFGAVLTASNSIRLGNKSISNISAQVGITVTSDRRRKKDIQALDANLGLDFIEKLQPVSYRFNNGDETERYGFIAQDLEQALPASLQDTVEKSEPEHGLAMIERQHDEDRTYHVSYGELTAPIVKAIQQQQQEITEMRQQNVELRHFLAAVEHQVSALKTENEALRYSIRSQRAQITTAR
jgi:hypothetical protein